jgi:ABC-type phosphate transport system substrate-binding protein
MKATRSATLSSTEAVKRYVASDPNAIGYVDAGYVDSTVRLVLELL